MLEEDLCAYLLADTALSALVGHRIYPLVQPQGTDQPCLTYLRPGTLRSQTLTHTDSTVRASIQIDSWDTSYAGVKAVSRALRQRLIDYRGLMGSTRVKNIAIDQETDLGEDEPGLYRVLHIFLIWHLEV